MTISQQTQPQGAVASFLAELNELRWDDHRYYHQSRINQSLHFLSSISFMTAYIMLFINPGVAALIGWGIGMVSRQSGHFFFEPRDYDHINKATHEHKEEIKVGYNLNRKRVLHAIWAAIPVVLVFDPTLLGTMQAYTDFNGFLNNMAIAWLVLGVAALLFRTIHLFFIRDIKTGLAWCLKIITDPFHDFKIYMKSPLYLMRGELMDPMTHAMHENEEHELNMRS
ncbi:hypothetical protein A3742_06635 [Oleiphilus sp. HI0071]|uniref:hypothetical protein n=2 Tax=Oleiphilus TaxID=141450 RepID=UPI0007C2C169|nr:MULTISPECIES: hypothetical protein [unclassified Oleiphilus]KZY63545.1 hypothetical protein A3737_18455 [Oleiphilus sp. HI0065]KZY83525.1 hypothetical protein A3742_06635 [Oleiphilus sp. HI0071]KZY91564.1 hypothetical protein A3744_20515 [Oleiphilus sp. HI0073]KZZ50011.1 hypothetical protein A3760_14240 [Oleiphilus sp. HI0122]KZZ79032.1 hypothetical protein A3767_12115 [Oleiphilus sp. HI0133]